MGKLGLPVAVAINSKGHDVIGYDINPKVKGYLDNREIPYQEEDLQPLLDKHTVKWADSIKDVVAKSEIIFLAIQTPHDPKFEGDKRIPEERADFNYTYLVDATTEVAKQAAEQKKFVSVVTISTCLPGTFEREILPIFEDPDHTDEVGRAYVNYMYNPFFIAMGTVLQDFLDPEFVLLGSCLGSHDELVKEFYSTIHNRPTFTTDIKTAEGIKVFYNTFITMKTVLANTYGEMAHKLGMNVDDIYKALSLATDRIVSPKYLKAGMGDGGGCHPRDNIALSYLAKQVGLSHNIFEDLMAAREDHAAWLADVIIAKRDETGLPVIMLGRAFKPETNIETGSPSVLVHNILEEKGLSAHHLEDFETEPDIPWLVFIGTQHERYTKMKFLPGSVVIDPFGYIPDQEDVEVIRVGRS